MSSIGHYESAAPADVQQSVRAHLLATEHWSFVGHPGNDLVGGDEPDRDGTLGALIADASGGGPVAVSISGTIAGVAYLSAMLEIGRRSLGDHGLMLGSPLPSSNSSTSSGEWPG